MPTCKDLRCTIYTKDGALQEYQLSGDQTSAGASQTRTVYIEAQDGLSFWILFEALPGYKFALGNAVLFEKDIDGKQLEWDDMVDKTSRIKDCKGIYTTDGVEGWFFQPFQFSGILLDEDHESGDSIDKDSLENLGEISVYAFRCNNIKARRSPQKVTQELQPNAINEKVLKGKNPTHVVQSGPKQTIPPKMVFGAICLDDPEHPYVHFRFLYRSKRALQNLGLVPRTPPPSPPPPISPPAAVANSRPQIKSEDLNMEQEIARLRSEFQAQLDALQDKYKIKRKIKEEEGNDPRQKRVKVEGVGKVRAKPIDLTRSD